MTYHDLLAGPPKPTHFGRVHTTHGGDPALNNNVILCCSVDCVECIDSLGSRNPSMGVNVNGGQNRPTYELTRLKFRYRIASLPLEVHYPDPTSSDSGNHCRLAPAGNSLKTLNCSSASALCVLAMIPAKYKGLSGGFHKFYVG